MASFYAELQVAGHTYPVRHCTHEFTQATDVRGRVVAKVRHGLVHIVMNVPDDSFLETWAHAPFKPLAGRVVFFQTKGAAARETLSWEAGHCVGYVENFQSGSLSDGSYVCQVTITAPKLVLSPGGPLTPFVAPTPRDYAYVPPALAASMQTAVTAPVLSKQQRYDARMSLLDQARAKLAEGAPVPAGPLAAPADATRVAPGASANRLSQERQRLQQATDRLARNNVAVERARLSEHVYASDKIPPAPAPEGWHQLTAKELARKGITPEILADPKSGFKAALYQSSFERPPKLVVAYAGTENVPDWTTNLQQGIGFETEQYDRAMKLADKITKSFPKGTVDITGHSLGGGLASAASVVTRIKGYTFNAAGLHPNTVGRAPYNVSPKNMMTIGKRIDAYHSTADPLTNLQSGIALAQGPRPPLVLGPEALGIPHATNPAAHWQHEWQEIVSRHPLDASGKMALDGHGVDPQLVDHIEAQKDQDTATLTKYVAP